MPDLLKISLLGPPVVKIAESPLAIRRRQVRALLYRLAVEPRPLSRSYLGYLFWCDLPENTAQRNLSRLLVYLTRNFPDPGLIQINKDFIQLSLARSWVDTIAFSQHWEAWELTHHLEDLQAAADLYRGSFLDGFATPENSVFSDWVSLEKECWEQRYLKVLEALIDETAAQGDIPRAIEYACQYLHHNSLAEAIHCRLIELYAALGDRIAALRQYEQCSEILERDLGVKPAPETYAAYQAVVNPQFSEIETNTSQPVWKASPGLQVPFVGRRKIIQLLAQRLAQARSGNGGVVLVSGEAGIGKTRLLLEFTQRQRLRTRVISGSASPESVSMPYQPIVEALRPLLRLPEILPYINNIQNTWFEEASRLMPELAAIIQPTQPRVVVESGVARARIFEALCRIIFSFTRGGYTVLLCLDDLHWADSTTLDWLAYLGRRLSGQRVLVLGSYRPEENDMLTGLRQILSRHTDLLEISLPGLNEEEVWCLVSGLGERIPANPDQAERLRVVTGGNPFFILETLRALQETSQSSSLKISLENIPLPDSVRQAVNFRLEKLPPGSRQILEAGAVLGQVFNFETITLTAGRGELETLDGLDELVTRQFLVEQASGYRFNHAIVREAVYSSLSLWRRCRLHLRAGEALEKFPPGDAISLAWHFDQAGVPGKSAKYYLKAGHEAREVFAHVEARACFDRALALLEHETPNLEDPQALAENQRQRIQAFFERGWALRLLGEMSTYTSDLEEVARLAQTLGDPRTLAHLYWQQAYNHRWFCRYDLSWIAAEKGIRLSQEIGDTFLQAVCQRELGMAARETGEYDAAQAALEGALNLFKSIQETVYTIHTLCNLSTLFMRRQDPEEALRLAHEAMEICEQKNLRYERRLPLGDMGVSTAALGETQKARSNLEESLSIAREIADRTQEIFCLGNLGFILGGLGQDATALQFLDEALELSEKIGSASEQSWLHASLAETHFARGDSRQAALHARAAVEIAAAYSRKPDLHRAQQLLSRIHLQHTP